MFPLKCTNAELVEFVEGSATHVDGWFSFYWGEPADKLLSKENRTVAESVTASWLKEFQKLGHSPIIRNQSK